MSFHNSIIGNFMFSRNQLATNLLQLFAHPQNSESFSIISVILFEVSIVAEQKLVTIFCFLLVSIVLNAFTSPLPYRCSGVPAFVFRSFQDSIRFRKSISHFKTLTSIV